MLHILLGILKIIGIILAVIVGLILLIICVVLFTALRYELKLAANGDVKNIESSRGLPAINDLKIKFNKDITAIITL